MQRRINDLSRTGTVRHTGTLILVALFGVIGFAPPSSGAERLGSYLALKGGVYSPSASYRFDNLNLESTFDSDTRTGVNGEVAFGHYVLPTLALELGLGYFKRSASLQSELAANRYQVDFDVIPVIASAKALIPVGSVDPYGEAGIGAYFTRFDVGDNLNTFEGTTTFGMHAGGGVNVNVSRSMFVGAESRYVWANPSVGGERITLNAEEYALNGFRLNGFTTTLGVGFGF